MMRHSRCSVGSSESAVSSTSLVRLASTADSGPSVASSWGDMSSVVSSRRVRPALKWSVARLRAMVISQAPKSRPCQRKLFMLRRARKNVSEVRSSASACERVR